MRGTTLSWNFWSEAAKVNPKYMSCIIIAKLIPDLESVAFTDITEMLQVVSDGVSRFEETTLDKTNAGKILSQYVKLKLKK